MISLAHHAHFTKNSLSCLVFLTTAKSTQLKLGWKPVRKLHTGSTVSIIYEIDQLQFSVK